MSIPPLKSDGDEASDEEPETDTYEPKSSTDEEDDALTREPKKKIKRLELDREFVSIQLGDNLAHTVRIAANLFEEVKEQLIKCLRSHADLFA